MRKLFEPAACAIDLGSGEMSDATGRYTKYFRDLAGLYGDEAAFAAMAPQWNDRAVYDVCEFRPNDAAGDLIFGVTRMSSGKVGDEFFITRGHAFIDQWERLRCAIRTSLGINPATGARRMAMLRPSF